MLVTAFPRLVYVTSIRVRNNTSCFDSTNTGDIVTGLIFTSSRCGKDKWPTSVQLPCSNEVVSIHKWLVKNICRRTVSLYAVRGKGEHNFNGRFKR